MRKLFAGLGIIAAVGAGTTATSACDLKHPPVVIQCIGLKFCAQLNG